MDREPRELLIVSESVHLLMTYNARDGFSGHECIQGWLLNVRLCSALCWMGDRKIQTSGPCVKQVRVQQERDAQWALSSNEMHSEYTGRLKRNERTSTAVISLAWGSEDGIRKEGLWRKRRHDCSPVCKVSSWFTWSSGITFSNTTSELSL